MRIRTLLLALAVAFSLLSGPADAQDESRGPELPTVYIAGDSTSADGVEGARGWGRHLGVR